MRPPESVTCDRSQLTSYAGTVTSFQRSPGADRVVIATDWGTLEEVRVFHATPFESGLPYLVFGEPMQSPDWRIIEREPGLLKPGVRAVAWVCADPAHPVIVDWQPGNNDP